jgi:hypothetical protein
MISGTGANDVWAFARQTFGAEQGRGELYRYAGTWSTVVNNDRVGFLSAAAPGHVFWTLESTPNAFIYRHTGSTFQRVFKAAFGGAPTGLHGRTKFELYALGLNGTVNHFDGVSWASFNTGTSSTLRDAWSAPDAAFFVGDNATVVRWRHACGVEEHACGDRWDNDCDGLINCADPDCDGDAECIAGGYCAGAAAISCNTTIMGTTVSGPSNIDAYYCGASAFDGQERAYRFIAPASGTATATVTPATGGNSVGLVALGAFDNGACDPLGSCINAAQAFSTTPVPVTFAVTAGDTYYVVVDSEVGQKFGFSLQLQCP